MADAKARLVEVIGAALNDGWQHEAGLLADALLAAGVTLPPQPAGPVTSEEAHRTFRDALSTGSNSFSDYGHLDDEDRVVERHALDAAMPLLARDHGYVKLSEVERRAREFWALPGHFICSATLGDLVAALTREAK